MLVTFLYLYFRDKGREISWKEFVNYYLAQGLVREVYLRFNLKPKTFQTMTNGHKDNPCAAEAPKINDALQNRQLWRKYVSVSSN